MNPKTKNILTILAIFLITILTIYILTLIPNYLGLLEADDIGFQPSFIIVFITFVIISIGIPAWFHRKYINDYSKIQSIWFFALFGGITGAILGEQGNIVMIIPYTILMLIYAFFYSKFTWWKVALTSYLGGVIVENLINRSPIQAPTILWVAFFVYPYFITKIWENRKKLSFTKIISDLKYTIISSIILIILAIYISKNNISPPLIIWGAALPFFIKIIYDFFKKK